MATTRKSTGIVLMVSLVGPFAWVRPASAESARTASLAYSEVWPAAVRFLRIDENARLVEKDMEAGYVLFEVQNKQTTVQGALELVRTKGADKRERTRVVITLKGQPSYSETLLLDRLFAKLRKEQGATGGQDASADSADK